MRKNVYELVGFQAVSLLSKYGEDIKHIREFNSFGDKRTDIDNTVNDISIDCFTAGYLAGIRDARSGQNECKLKRTATL